MMNELLKNPVLISAGVMSLGIGLPILVAYVRGYLPTRTQDKEKSDRIRYLEQQLELAHKHIESLPTQSEVATLKLELEAVRTNLRRDLDGKDKQITELNSYIRQLVQDAFNQQESVQSVTTTLASLAQQLPVLVFAVQDFVSKERQQHGKN